MGLDLTVGTAKEQPLPTLQRHAQYVATILKMAKVQIKIVDPGFLNEDNGCFFGGGYG